MDVGSMLDNNSEAKARNQQPPEEAAQGTTALVKLYNSLISQPGQGLHVEMEMDILENYAASMNWFEAIPDLQVSPKRDACI
ncbi:hypothetical protein ABBQ32_000450 [Trebouxia sp. C0010 RCD-2024]